MARQFAKKVAAAAACASALLMGASLGTQPAGAAVACGGQERLDVAGLGKYQHTWVFNNCGSTRRLAVRTVNGTVAGCQWVPAGAVRNIHTIYNSNWARVYVDTVAC